MKRLFCLCALFYTGLASAQETAPPAESEEEALKTISDVPWGDEVNAESITVRKLDE